MKTTFKKLIYISLLPFALSSCYTVRKELKKEDKKMGKLVSNEMPSQLFELKYVTNRVAKNKDLFGGHYTKELKYGSRTYIFPKDNSPLVPSPLASDDSTKLHKYKVLANMPLDKGAFHQKLEQNFRILRDSPNSIAKDQAEIYVFVHGFNNTFNDGSYRAAQIFYDLGLDGTPIVYSWPSAGNVFSYFKDKHAANKSAELFTAFIEDLSTNFKEKKINIIAHSMGNRVLAQASNYLVKKDSLIRFNHVIMAAPDISAYRFRKKYYAQLNHKAEKITLYASKKDKALKASTLISLRPRLGSGRKIYIADPIQTVDLSLITCKDFLLHSCFSSSQDVIWDMKHLLTNNLEAMKRQAVGQTPKQYYRLGVKTSFNIEND